MRLILVAVGVFLGFMGFMSMISPGAEIGARVFGGLVFAAVIYFWSPLSPLKRQQSRMMKQRQDGAAQAAQEWMARIGAGERMDRNALALEGTQLSDDEDVIFFVQAKWLQEQVVGYEGGGASVRMQLVKGVSVGTSSGRGKAKKEWSVVSEGIFLITTQRVVFTGNFKSWSAPRSKVISMTNPTADGLVVQLNGKTYFLYVPQAIVPVAQVALQAT